MRDNCLYCGHERELISRPIVTGFPFDLACLDCLQMQAEARVHLYADFEAFYLTFRAEARRAVSDPLAVARLDRIDAAIGIEAAP